MEEYLSTVQSLVEAEQWNGGPQKKQILVENETTARSSKQEQEMYKSIERRKGVECQPTAVGI